MLSRWSAVYRELGPVAATLQLVDRGLRRISGDRGRLLIYRITAQPVPPPPAADQAVARGRLVVCEAFAGDAVLAQCPRPPAVIARRFANGARCLCASDGGAFVGFLWLQLGGYEEDEVRCRFQLPVDPPAAWDFDVYIDPAYRMGRALARLWSAANAELARLGVAWSFSRISAFNPASQRSHARLGAVPCGRMAVLALGPLEFAAVDRWPFAHVSVDPRHRLVYELQTPSTARSP